MAAFDTDDINHFFEGAVDLPLSQQEAIIEEMLWCVRRARGISGDPVHLGTSDLCHEVYRKLQKQKTPWRNRSHFFAALRNQIRWAIFRLYRKPEEGRSAGKSRLSTLHIELQEEIVKTLDPRLVPLQWEFIRDLARVPTLDHETTTILEMRVFEQMTIPQICEELNLSKSTVQRRLTEGRRLLKEGLMK